jgi:malonyl-CoA O-methyltransferase
VPKPNDIESNVIKEFSRFAFEYENYHSIQVEVSEYLVETLAIKSYKTVIDMGCGSGAVYKAFKAFSVSVDTFVAIDSSIEMLRLHPSSLGIVKRCENFNTSNAFDNLDLEKGDLFLSSSALQWSEDLVFTFSNISQIAPSIHLAIFTSNTFKSLHECAGLSSPIYSPNTLENVIKKYYDASFELKTYRLYFENTREMFQYIKKSGVSGGEKRLSFKESKALLRNYPLEYLEFEVLFVQGLRWEND